ncbi:MAG: acetylglutamate kinase [Actinomycetota bacterium]|nr:acetylglutamate kinase [Actinomycetota bacterium]
MVHMEEVMGKAQILTEALPYIKEYHGKTVVIKYGGAAMEQADLKETVATDIVLMKYVGLNPIIVHGGGPEISRQMKAMGKEAKFINGLRVTDKETMDIVKMVLVGKINKEIVSLINRHGEHSVGVSGDDGNLIMAKKKATEGYDLGFVGEVTKINRKLLENLINDDFIPVVATVGVGEDGMSYNINADKVAGEIAAALNADKIIFLTDVDGLYEDFDDKDSLISELSIEECERRLAGREINQGMIPKVEGCVNAVKSGVKRAHILNGTTPHALLLEIFTDEGVGTMITKKIEGDYEVE